MVIAQAKRKENIAEYLLYMWQVEDIIRANEMDMERIEANVIARYDCDDALRHDIREWYDSLVKMMQLEQVKEHGHLQINKNVLIRLNDLHLALLAAPDKFPVYRATFYSTLPFIVELRAKMPQGQQTGELETCFNVLYGIILLNLQHKEITPETMRAVKQISQFIGMLAAYFKKDEEKPLFEDDNI